MEREGDTVKVQSRSVDLLVFESGEWYEMGPMPSEHDRKHADVKAGDCLVVAPMNADFVRTAGQLLVYVAGGCSCRFVIYPEGARLTARRPRLLGSP